MSECRKDQHSSSSDKSKETVTSVGVCPVKVLVSSETSICASFKIRSSDGFDAFFVVFLKQTYEENVGIKGNERWATAESFTSIRVWTEEKMLFKWTLAGRRGGGASCRGREGKRWWSCLVYFGGNVFHGTGTGEKIKTGDSTVLLQSWVFLLKSEKSLIWK